MSHGGQPRVAAAKRGGKKGRPVFRRKVKFDGAKTFVGEGGGRRESGLGRREVIGTRGAAPLAEGHTWHKRKP